MPFTVTIGGVDRSDYVLVQTLSIDDILTSQPNRASFSMFIPASAPTSHLPKANQEVIVTSNTGVEFAGVVITQPRGLADKTGARIVQVTSQDYQFHLTRRRPALVWDNTTAGQIALDLLATITGYGFTAGSIEQGPTLKKWTVNYITVADALEQLCNAVGFDWYVGYDKKLNFFDSTGSYAGTAWTLEEVLTNNVYVASAPYDNDQFAEDLSQVRNITTLIGARTPSALSTQTAYGNGSSRNFVLNLGAVTASSLTMNVGGAGVTVGEEGVIDPSVVQYLVNYKNRSVQATAGTATIGSGVLITFTYRYEQQIIQISRNAASIASYGEIEHVINAPQVTDRTIAQQIISADLALYGQPAVSFSYDTYRSGLVSGMKQRVTLPRQDISGLFGIRSIRKQLVNYAPNGTTMQPAGYVWKWSVNLEKLGD